MPFINHDKLKATVAKTVKKKHAIFEHGDVPLNVRVAYLQVCVIAALETCDRKDVEERVKGLGLSLQLGESEIHETVEACLGYRETMVLPLSKTWGYAWQMMPIGSW